MTAFESMISGGLDGIRMKINVGAGIREKNLENLDPKDQYRTK